ncbi:MAG: SO_0444 family Cu/Zn efflux transporter [Magnetococcales bacterium]|nr:SO_0444 family Cu/Zn efflux transporter [Magnetococcales bacterium]
MSFLNNLLDLLLDIAPWLLVGLLLAGLVKAWLPEALVARWLGGRGIGPIVRGALVGAPLPLCSCSVIPVAMGLRRGRASKPATVAFLVSTPETGIDSVALSWTMLGPFMTVVRPVAAILSAVLAGLLTLLAEREESAPPPPPAPHRPLGRPILRIEPATRSSGPVIPVASSAAPPGTGGLAAAPAAADGCGGSGCGCGPAAPARADAPFLTRTRDGLAYALTNLWDDIAPWIAIGIVLTAVVQTWMDPGQMQGLVGGGWLAMLAMVLISMPVYVCATASTPMAAAMLYSGVSPGMTLAFLIAGPATNLAPLGIIRRELGGRVLTAYLSGILLSAMGLGLAVDAIAQTWNLAPLPAEILARDPAEAAVPVWLAAASVLLLTGLGVRRLGA